MFCVFVVRVVKMVVVVVLMLELRDNGYILLRFMILMFIRGVKVDVKIELDWIKIVNFILIKMVMYLVK